MVDAPKSTSLSLKLPTAGLDAMPEVASLPPHSISIKGMAQRGYIVTKKGRQIYAGQRLLIDFIRQKFREATLP